MRINKSIQNSLVLIQYLSSSVPASLEVIANESGISQAFLEQLARKLRIAGIIKSHRGPGGGYTLLAMPTYRQLMESVDEGFSTSSPNIWLSYSLNKALDQVVQ